MGKHDEALLMAGAEATISPQALGLWHHKRTHYTLEEAGLHHRDMARLRALSVAWYMGCWNAVLNWRDTFPSTMLDVVFWPWEV